MEPQTGDRGVLLWIDDEPRIIEAYVEVLRFEGYGVSVASNNDDALRIIQTQRVDLVIQDIFRPLGACLSGGEGVGETSAREDHSGILFYKRFLAGGETRKPCVFVTAGALGFWDDEWFREQPDTWVLWKPCDVDTLLSTVAMALESHREVLYSRLAVPTILVPGLETLNDELVHYLAQHPEYMYELRPRLFEELVAHLLESMGWEVDLTRPSKDGGIDILAVQHGDVAPVLCVVECKRYGPDNRVGLGLVQRLHGVREAVGANVAVLATTSFFTKGAEDFQRSVGFKLALKDHNALRTWLANCAGPDV